MRTFTIISHKLTIILFKAIQESYILKSRTLNIEHILLAILHDKNSLAYHFLINETFLYEDTLKDLQNLYYSKNQFYKISKI